MTRSYQSEIKAIPIEEDDILNGDKNNDNQNKDPNEKWYLINESKTIPQAWEMIMNAFTIYTLFTTPFM